MTSVAPLLSPVIDDRPEKELVTYGLARVIQASNGLLSNSIDLGSPERALIEGFSFAAAELLYRLNKLPEAAVIEFLQIAGVQRILGTAASVRLTFTLTQSLSNTFTVPSGYLVTSVSGQIQFTTDEILQIPPGNISGSIGATCTEIGTQGNLSAYTLTRLSESLAFLKSVTNTEPSTGGNDAESLDTTKARGFAAIRRRGLISADDYVQETITVLGAGSVAAAIGNLAADKISERIGSVHVFALGPGGLALTTQQISDLQTALAAKSPVAVSVYVSSIDRLALTITVIAQQVPGSNVETVAQAIYARINNHLAPAERVIGEPVILSEISFQARLAGVEYVQTVTMGEAGSTEQPIDINMPNQYALPYLQTLNVQLVLNQQVTIRVFGVGDPD